MKNQLKTPILLILFNRPDCTAQVLDAVRSVQPKSLYIAIDGPRKENGEDMRACQRVKELIETIDWKCDVKTRIRKENLGCKYGPVDAIRWFFQHVNEGIILEDDIIPDMSFFYFCQGLLEKYRYDTHIGLISGDNFIHNYTGRYSYFFSKYSQTNGWATWRRVWKLYDIHIKRWPEMKKAHLLDKLFPNIWTRVYWTLIFDAVYNNEIQSAWDYQWTFSSWVHGLFSIMPKTNLIRNIGFGRKDATHTKRINWISRIPVIPMKFPLVHPEQKVVDPAFDELLQKRMYILWKELVMNPYRKWRTFL